MSGLSSFFNYPTKITSSIQLIYLNAKIGTSRLRNCNRELEGAWSPQYGTPRKSRLHENHSSGRCRWRRENSFQWLQRGRNLRSASVQISKGSWCGALRSTFAKLSAVSSLVPFNPIWEILRKPNVRFNSTRPSHMSYIDYVVSKYIFLKANILKHCWWVGPMMKADDERNVILEQKVKAQPS